MTDVAVTLRPATWADCERLFVWVNAADSLKNKRQTRSAIPYETHRRWFELRLQSPDTILLIAERDGMPVGQVRLEPREHAYEVDVFVVPEARGCGVASAAVEAAARNLQTREPDARLRAWVSAENRGSVRLFEALGFHAAGASDGFTAFERMASGQSR